MYTTVPIVCRQFLYLPDITSASNVTFSAKFDTEAQLLANLRGSSRVKVDTKLQALSERLESLRHLSSRLTQIEEIAETGPEERLIQAVSNQAKPEAGTEKARLEEGSKKAKIADVVKGFLPSKRKEKESREESQARKKPGVKMVTPLQSKKPKKK
jgi:hypothetical protein